MLDLGLSQDDISACETVIKQFDASAHLFRKFQMIQRDNSPGAGLARFLKVTRAHTWPSVVHSRMQKFVRELGGLEAGQFLLAPGGWRFKQNGQTVKHDIVYIVICTDKTDESNEPLYDLVSDS